MAYANHNGNHHLYVQANGDSSGSGEVSPTASEILNRPEMIKDLVMERLFGLWTVERSENYNEYLAKSGVKMTSRKLLVTAKPQKKFSKNTDGSFLLVNRMSVVSNSWEFRIGEDFKGEDFIGRLCTIRFEFDGLNLVEFHLNSTTQEWQPHAVYSREGRYLVETLHAEGIRCKRYYQKTA